MKISKKIQNQISAFLASNYGFNVQNSFQSVNSFMMNLDQAIVSVTRKPVIGQKDVFSYKIVSKNINNNKIFFKNTIVDDFLLKSIKEINRLNYVVYNEKSMKVSELKITEMELTLFSGLLDDLDKPFEPTFGFWLASSSGEKLAYVIIKADGSLSYQGEQKHVSEFGTLLINQYCEYISRFDEYFESDGEYKSYETRMEELKDTLLVKDMFEI
jgi:hypothetical protein